MRTLFVDDEPPNRVIGKRMLVKLGQRCDVLTDGDEVMAAVEAAQKSGDPYDIVFLDIVMRRLWGDELAVMLRKRFPTLPVVAVTGNSATHDVGRYMKMGFDAVILKPYNMEHLKHALNQFCG